jgi:hypothetical protein
VFFFRLEKVPNFAWIEKIVQDNDRLVQLPRAFNAKVERSEIKVWSPGGTWSKAWNAARYNQWGLPLEGSY